MDDYFTILDTVFHGWQRALQNNAMVQRGLLEFLREAQRTGTPIEDVLLKLEPSMVAHLQFLTSAVDEVEQHRAEVRRKIGGAA